MSVQEFKSRIKLIMNFTIKMNKEIMPFGIQKVFIKIYAATLDINLTDEMINEII